MFRQADRRAIEQNEDAPAADLSHTGFEHCSEQLVSADESSCDCRAASNPTPPPTAGTTAPLQPTQFAPGTVSFYQYGVPAIVQAPPMTINPFYGPSPLEFQIGHGIRSSVLFPQVINNCHSLPLMTQIPYMLIPGPGYQYLRTYEYIQPPALYPPGNWQSTIFPHPTPPPAFGAKRDLSDSSRHHRSPSPVAEIEDPSDYPELRDWLEDVDRDHLRGLWGHQFSWFLARLELVGLTSLLHLERMTSETLIDMTGMEEIAAERLLRFVHEDISEIRANRPLHPERTRNSY